MKYKLRPHQIKASKEVLDILNTYKCAYLRGMVRSGKTLTVLETAKLYGAKNVLFITKKKAISSILSDYNNFGYTYSIEVINYESVHKVVNTKPDLIIYDEAHVLSAFPKPSKRVKIIKKMFSSIPCIWLSGTPAAESNSQYFHQFFVSDYSPFKNWTNFYKWSKDFVNVTEKRIGTHTVKDYSDANEKMIEKIIDPLTVKMTQKDAGFKVKIKEHLIRIETPDVLHKLAQRLIKDRAIEGKKGFIMAEMPAKLQSKVHQIYNGTCILEDIEGESIPHIFSNYKAQYIKRNFRDKKIAIMYYFQAESEILKSVFGVGITTDLDEFNDTDKNFAIQASSSEGMNISKADCIVYYNLGFSGKDFIQGRDRMTVKGREENDVYFILETPGINEEILNRVRDKKDFNLSAFKKSFL